MNDEQLLRYSRHILLDEVGIDGQERLLAGRALVLVSHDAAQIGRIAHKRLLLAAPKTAMPATSALRAPGAKGVADDRIAALAQRWGRTR